MEPILEFGYDDTKARLGVESFAELVVAKAEAMNVALSSVRADNLGDGAGLSRYAKSFTELEHSSERAAPKVDRLLSSLDHMSGTFSGGLGIGVAIGGLALLEKTLDKGIQKAREFQVAQISIAAHLTSAFNTRGSDGKIMDDKEAFKTNLVYAKKLQSELLTMSTQNHLTFQEQVGAFQASISAGARKGLNVDQILQLSNQAAMVGKAIGLHGQEIENAARLMVGGGVNVSRSAIGMNLGISNADLATRKGKDLYDFLNTRTKGFKAAQAEFGQSLEGTISTLESKIDVAASKIGMRFMTKAKPSLDGLISGISGKLAVKGEEGHENETDSQFAKRLADSQQNADKLDATIDALTAAFVNMFGAMEKIATSSAFQHLITILSELAQYADKIVLAAVFYGIGKAALSATLGVAKLVSGVRALAGITGVEDLISVLGGQGLAGKAGAGGAVIGRAAKAEKVAESLSSTLLGGGAVKGETELAKARRDALRAARDGTGMVDRAGQLMFNDWGRYKKQAADPIAEARARSMAIHHANAAEQIERKYSKLTKGLDTTIEDAANFGQFQPSAIRPDVNELHKQIMRNAAPASVDSIPFMARAKANRLADEMQAEAEKNQKEGFALPFNKDLFLKVNKDMSVLAQGLGPMERKAADYRSALAQKQPFALSGDDQRRAETFLAGDANHPVLSQAKSAEARLAGLTETVDRHVSDGSRLFDNFLDANGGVDKNKLAAYRKLSAERGYMIGEPKINKSSGTYTAAFQKASDQSIFTPAQEKAIREKADALDKEIAARKDKLESLGKTRTALTQPQTFPGFDTRKQEADNAAAEAQRLKEKYAQQKYEERRSAGLLTKQEKAVETTAKREADLTDYRRSVAQRDTLVKTKGLYDKVAGDGFAGAFPQGQREAYAGKSLALASKIESLSAEIDSHPGAYESLTKFQKLKFQGSRILNSAKGVAGGVAEDAANGAGNALMYGAGGLLIGQGIKDAGTDDQGNTNAFAGITGSMVQGAGVGMALGSVIPGLGTAVGGAVGAVGGGIKGVIDATIGKKIAEADAQARQGERDLSDMKDRFPNGVRVSDDNADIRKQQTLLARGNKQDPGKGNIWWNTLKETGGQGFFDEYQKNLIAAGQQRQDYNTPVDTDAARARIIADIADKTAAQKTNGVQREAAEAENNDKQYQAQLKSLSPLAELPDFKKMKENLDGLVKVAAIKGMGATGQLPGSWTTSQTLSNMTGLKYKEGEGLKDIVGRMEPSKGAFDDPDFQLARLMKRSPKLAAMYKQFQKTGLPEGQATPGESVLDQFNQYVNNQEAGAESKQHGQREDHYDKQVKRFTTDTNFSDEMARESAMAKSEHNDKLAELESGLASSRLEADKLFGDSSSAQGKKYVGGMMNRQVSDVMDERAKSVAEFGIKDIEERQKQFEQANADKMYPLQKRKAQLEVQSDAINADNLKLKGEDLVLRVKKLNLEMEQLALKPKDMQIERTQLNLQRDQIERQMAWQGVEQRRMAEDRPMQQREDQRGINAAQRGLDAAGAAANDLAGNLGSGRKALKAHLDERAEYEEAALHPFNGDKYLKDKKKSIEDAFGAAADGVGDAQDKKAKADQAPARHAEDYAKSLDDMNAASKENVVKLDQNTQALAKLAIEVKASALEKMGKFQEAAQLRQEGKTLKVEGDKNQIKTAEDKNNLSIMDEKYLADKTKRGFEASIFGLGRKKDLQDIGDDDAFMKKAVPFLKKNGVSVDADTLQEFYQATRTQAISKSAGDYIAAAGKAATGGARIPAMNAQQGQSRYAADHLAQSGGQDSGDINVPVSVQSTGITRDEYEKELPGVVKKAIDDWCRSKSRKP